MDDSGNLGEYIRTEGGSRMDSVSKDTNPKDALGVAKAPFHCVSAAVMLELGLAMMEGGRKYGTHNYRKMGVRGSVYYNATMRHVMDWWEGQDIDPDSGVSHIIKAIAGLVVMRDSMLMRNFEDDRPIRLPDQLNIDELNEQAKDIIKKYPVCKMPFIHAGPMAKPHKDYANCSFSDMPDVDCGCATCRAIREIEKGRTKSKNGSYARAGDPWGTYEGIMLRMEVKRNLPMTLIAEMHQRTVIAIESRMEKLKIDYKAEIEHEENKITYDNAVDGMCYHDDRLCKCSTCRAGWNENLV
jgi:hypothetical protein